MRADVRALAHFDFCANDAVRTNADAVADFSARRNHGAGVDACHEPGPAYSTVRMVHIKSASTANSVPTKPRALNLKMPERMRSSVTSKVS